MALSKLNGSTVEVVERYTYTAFGKTTVCDSSAGCPGELGLTIDSGIMRMGGTVKLCLAVARSTDAKRKN